MFAPQIKIIEIWKQTYERKKHAREKLLIYHANKMRQYENK